MDNYLICRENNLARGFDYYLHTHHEYGGAHLKTDNVISICPRDKPLFLFVNFMTCHLPYIINPTFFRGCPDDEIRDFTTINLEDEDYLMKVAADAPAGDIMALREKWHRGYLSTYEYLDYQLAVLFDRLKKRRLLENSTIVITADHGEDIFEHRVTFRGDDVFILEHYSSHNSTLWIPLIMRSPEQNPSTCDNLVSNVDILPMLLSQLGIACPSPIDGQAMNGSARDAVLSENSVLDCSALIEKRHKLISYGDRSELYDLADDSTETHCLDDEATKERMREKMKALCSTPMQEEVALDDVTRREVEDRFRALGYMR